MKQKTDTKTKVKNFKSNKAKFNFAIAKLET